MMQWEYSSLPQSLIDTKAIQWNKDKLLTTLLLNRGFSDEKSVNEFINPEISDFRNPFKFEKRYSGKNPYKAARARYALSLIPVISENNDTVKHTKYHIFL